MGALERIVTALGLGVAVIGVAVLALMPARQDAKPSPAGPAVVPLAACESMGDLQNKMLVPDDTSPATASETDPPVWQHSPGETCGRVVDSTTGAPLAALVSWRHSVSDVRLRAFTKCDSSGYFTFGRTTHVRYPGRTTVSMPGYTSREAVCEQFSLIELDPDPDGVVISIDIKGAHCFPLSAGLIWEATGTSGVDSAWFNESTGQAQIGIESSFIDEWGAGECRIHTNWFETAITSDVLFVQRGGRYEVSLEPPAGASVRCRVLGPDGLPVAGALLRQSNRASAMCAFTDELGEAMFLGVPKDMDLPVSLVSALGATVLTPEKTAVAGAADVLEFNLSGTGTVEVRFGESVTWAQYLLISPIGDSYWSDRVDCEPRGCRICGLAPGGYRVEVCGDGSSIVSNFEVLAPPQLSVWEFD